MSRVPGSRTEFQSAGKLADIVKNGPSNGLSSHILPTSATMVGVCMTVVSIVKLVHPGGFGFLIDKLLATDSLVFLASAILSFMSMRFSDHIGAARVERWAETAFLYALGLVAVAAVLLAFEIG